SFTPLSSLCAGCGDHPDLPSFPTRRSSDLAQAAVAQRVQVQRTRQPVLEAAGGVGGLVLEVEADAGKGRHASAAPGPAGIASIRDRKSTRLNSSHVKISYAVFCLKKKNRHP